MKHYGKHGQLQTDSNTTLVKVKSNLKYPPTFRLLYSNTTLVKVKSLTQFAYL